MADPRAALSPRARALIDAARGLDDPAPGARARGDAAVRVALAMHGVTDLPPLDPPRAASAPASTQPPAAPAPAAAKSFAHTGLALKLSLGAAVLLGAALFATHALPSPRPAQPVAARAAAPAAVLPVGQAAAALEAAGPRERATTVQRAVQPRPRARAPRARDQAKPAAIELEAEVALISAADGLVRAKRFAEALRVLADHERRFQHGALREERTALRVLSLCGRGQSAHARRERERFLRAAPRSVLAERVRDACTEAAP